MSPLTSHHRAHVSKRPLRPRGPRLDADGLETFAPMGLNAVELTEAEREAHALRRRQLQEAEDARLARLHQVMGLPGEAARIPLKLG